LFSPTISVDSTHKDTKFGDLLSACHQTEPITFSELFDQIEADYFTKIAEGAHSDVFRVYSYRGDSVFKVVKLGYVLKSWDRLFSEILIALKLSDLRKKLEYYTTGFLELRRRWPRIWTPIFYSVTCVCDIYPVELLKACEDFKDDGNNPGHNKKGTCGKYSKTKEPYLVWHMSYAGVPLDNVKLDGVLQLWSILQQVTLSVAVAEDALEFEHRNLHTQNILVKKTDEETSQFCIGGRSVVINTWGIKAHVIDYGSARITDGKVHSL
ncbi:unnamed protein product, partial [Ixodes pacificus]